MNRPASYYVTKDWSRFVREDDPEAAFGVAPVDIDRLGLRAALDAFEAGEADPSPAPPSKPSTRPADKRRRFPASTPRPAGASHGDDPS